MHPQAFVHDVTMYRCAFACARPPPTVLPTGEGTATLGSTEAHARVACAGAAYTYMGKKKTGAKPAGMCVRACVHACVRAPAKVRME